MRLLDQIAPLHPRLNHAEYGSFVDTVYLQVTGDAMQTILLNSS
jgi:hypothetical protein